MLTCEVDRYGQAVSCCLCAFPPPCLCEVCKAKHCGQPGFHYFLPLVARREIKSEKELLQIQSRYSQLPLKEKEFRSVLTSYQRASEQIEANFQEKLHALTEVKNKHLGKLQAAARLYESRINEAVKESYKNAWKGWEFTHPDPVVDFLLKHEPGKDPNFGLHYQIGTACKDFEQLFTVKWALSVPDFGHSLITTLS